MAPSVSRCSVAAAAPALPVGVIGAGQMGAGIAEVCARAHVDVLVFGHSHIPWDTTAPRVSEKSGSGEGASGEGGDALGAMRDRLGEGTSISALAREYAVSRLTIQRARDGTGQLSKDGG